MLGSSSYKTKADEAALFLGGKLSQHAPLTGVCGCSTGVPVLQAAASEEAPSEVTSPLPPDQPGQIHVEVETPFVFNARASGARPYMVAKINFSSLPNVDFAQEPVDPAVLQETKPEVSTKAARQESKPVQKDKESQEKKGFFGRVRGFFGGLFHR
jgi:hypothetical protein